MSQKIIHSIRASSCSDYKKNAIISSLISRKVFNYTSKAIFINERKAHLIVHFIGIRTLFNLTHIHILENLKCDIYSIRVFFIKNNRFFCFMKTENVINLFPNLERLLIYLKNDVLKFYIKLIMCLPSCIN
jgi:hypothetical protein